jgi:hypothetical protein
MIQKSNLCHIVQKRKVQNVCCSYLHTLALYGTGTMLCFIRYLSMTIFTLGESFPYLLMGEGPHAGLKIGSSTVQNRTFQD